ncbi:lysine--tRNA ligase [Candidatus Roizmanbacteria bacterium CG22_combo_CG10-13_8_21_14_all_34_12]|uniref:Lysine--tRNA ligase n=3 Tax=Candidatus Roizmaniibacteriota TaxID=1752723 RepID=A0A2H0C0I7_9BACT|nr:MAG: lysine--tRNA ligase [Candidatus Roizmanbacteria bacterium CG22_combo_CG10-13_8_21_14_all_34_12]
MIWPDREAKRLKERNLPLEWADDMKTPSGRVHVGSLRGVIVHDLIYKALKDIEVNAKFSYVFNDMDPMDGMPSYLDANKWGKHMGEPLYKIPSPEPGFKSFADYFAKEFISVFNSINCHPQIIWSSELHRAGKMNEVIKLILDKADVVRDIYKKVVKKDRASNWFPYNPICEKCGKIGTTSVYKWDGKYVYYKCEEKMVEWAEGCGYEGQVEPINENGKLVWKLDWPAHWKVIGVTIESSGKDHMSSGGSYDMGIHFCKNILGTVAPDALGGYEWFTIGGKKMSSSKGIGSSAKEVSQILPPDLLRFLLVRTPIKTHLDFDPVGDTIPNLFDDYDRCLNAYFLKLENNLPKDKAGEVAADYARIIELSEVKPLPKIRLYIPRFRTIINLLKAKNEDLTVFFETQKKIKLSSEEKAILEERIKYAKIYLEKYSQEKIDSVNSKEFLPSEKQKKFIFQLTSQLKMIKNMEDKDSVQNAIFVSIKESAINPKEAFTAFYQTLINKPFGPKAADLIQEFGIEKVIKLLNSNRVVINIKTTHLFPIIDKPEIFSIDGEVAKKYPSINIGIAVIKNINIKKSDPNLVAEIDQFVKSQSHLSNEVISAYPEVTTYRKLYKEMGIDWHSRRPSPEALLRRISQKKDLYQINTCVDAYNLIVMKNRVSVGAFDYDKFAFPTVMRFPKEGEEILLLGDHEPTKFKETELAYFDQNGGYNIDFNYRDAQRTAVTENTKDILLNIDGVYNITREKVEQSLKESIEIITKYCGGTVEFAGVVSAKQK